MENTLYNIRIKMYIWMFGKTKDTYSKARYWCFQLKIC